MITVGRELRRRTDGAIRLEVIGEAADGEARRALERAAAAGDLTWLGFLRSDRALARVSGSLAGLLSAERSAELPEQPADQDHRVRRARCAGDHHTAAIGREAGI